MPATSTSGATFELLTPTPIKSQVDSTKHAFNCSYTARLYSDILEIRHVVSQIYAHIFSDTVPYFYQLVENLVKSDLSASTDSTYAFALFY